MSPTDTTGDDFDFEDENNPPPLSPNRRDGFTGLRDMIQLFMLSPQRCYIVYSASARLVSSMSISINGLASKVTHSIVQSLELYQKKKKK